MEPTDFFTNIWELAKNASIFAVPLMLYAWLRAEAKRDQAEVNKDKAKDENKALLERTIDSNHRLADSIGAWNQIRIAQMNDQKLHGG